MSLGLEPGLQKSASFQIWCPRCNTRNTQRTPPGKCVKSHYVHHLHHKTQDKKCLQVVDNWIYWWHLDVQQIGTTGSSHKDQRRRGQWSWWDPAVPGPGDTTSENHIHVLQPIQQRLKKKKPWRWKRKRAVATTGPLKWEIILFLIQNRLNF